MPQRGAAPPNLLEEPSARRGQELSPDPGPLIFLASVFAQTDVCAVNIQPTRWRDLPDNWRQMPISEIEEAWRPMSAETYAQVQLEMNAVFAQAGLHAARALKAMLLSPPSFPDVQVREVGTGVYSVDVRYTWVGGLTGHPGVRCRLATKSFAGAPTEARVTLQPHAQHAREIVFSGPIYLGCGFHCKMGSTWQEVRAWDTPLVVSITEPQEAE